MTSIEETKRNIRIVFKARENINVSLVYNREFFQGMGLTNVRIHHEYSKKSSTNSTTNSKSTSPEEEILYKVPKPNSKEGWFSRLQKYIHPFLSMSNEEPVYNTVLKSQKWLHTETPNHDVIVLLPKHQFQFVSLKTFLFHRRNQPSIYHYKNSGLDFFHIQRLIKDTIQQMEYMKTKGVFITSFSIDSFVLINEQLFFIDPKHLQILATNKEFDDSISAFLAFFQKDVLQSQL